MKRETELDLLTRLQAYLESGQTASTAAAARANAAAYTDPGLAEAERRLIFAAEPIVVGFSTDIARPGDYMSVDVAGIPALVVRGKDGLVRAFRNMCRHRGVRLVTDDIGHAARFVCPFHAWAYDTQGALVGVPRKACFGPVADAFSGLLPLGCVERHGIVFVRAGPGPIDIDSHLGAVGDELAALGLGSLDRLGTKTMDVAINWKLAVDTFGETYHFETLHRHTVLNFFHTNVHAYDRFGRNHRMVFAGRELAALKAQPQAQWDYRANTLTAYYLFPTTQIIVMPHHVDLYRIFPHPTDPGRSRTIYSYYPSQGTGGGMSHEAAFEMTAHVIRGEDYATAEIAQANFAAAPDTPLLFGRNEPALHHYHATYRAALGLPELEPA